MYIVKDIIEPDFGCEGLPDGQEPCCEVLLEDDRGVSSVRMPDRELYEKDINAGDRVEIVNGMIRKIQIV